MESNTSASNFTCVVFGEDSLLIKCSEMLLEKKHKIFVIISENSRIKSWAASQNIYCISNDSDLNKNLSKEKFDYLFSITNLKIIPADILNLPMKTAINFHDGLLPKYAGINATSWAIINDEKSHGITWHIITTGVDAGAILNQVTVDISPDETALTLNTKCFEAGLISFGSLINELAAETYIKTEQNHKDKSYFAKYKKPDSAGIISWKQTSEEISSFIRGLNFGPYANPLAAAKIRINNEYIIVKGAKSISAKHQNVPGIIIDHDSESITVSAKGGMVYLYDFESAIGKKITANEIFLKYDLSIGSSFNELSDEWKKTITNYYSEICRSEPYWIKKLEQFEPIDIPFNSKSFEDSTVFSEQQIQINDDIVQYLNSNSGIDFELLIKSAFTLYIGKLNGKDIYDLGYKADPSLSGISPFETLFTQSIPLRINLDYESSAEEQIYNVVESYKKVSAHKTYIYDLIARTPHLISRKVDYSNFPVLIQDGRKNESDYDKNCKLILLYSVTDNQFFIVFNTKIIDNELSTSIVSQFNEFLTNIVRNLKKKLVEISIVTKKEKETLLVNWNNTKTDYNKEICIHRLFEEQVKLKPAAIAVNCNGHEITYNELNKKSDQLANYLSSKGIGNNKFVGISLNRSIHMMTAILGVLKAGGAYVPIDPQFPKVRMTMMIEDSECPVIITESSIKNNFELSGSDLVCIDTDWQKICSTATVKRGNPNSSDLAYVIYTSGSTGKPKGVMVTHANVVNFFTGMDQYIQFDDLSVWLAVTSLSFDISVLELLWTLTRGIRVVLYTGDDIKSSSHPKDSEALSHKIDFSLFYFSSYEGEKSENKYKLLIEGAKFGDKNDFAALWTPERHFYDFGGLYANPSITSAAISTITEKIKIRAGSVVAPLHSSIRIAEEWAMVDNLSEGRVGIAFAAGWQPNDFVIIPQNFEDRKNIMFNQVEEVQKLWQGKSVRFENPNGKMIDINILPKPVQKSLPVWITAAGNPETFEMAGKAGYNLLTHLLGQSIPEVAEKIRLYRKAWKTSGHLGEGNITLMLHTFVGPDERSVKEIVKEPMKNYLRSAANLVKEAAWSFPTFKQATTNADGNFSIDHLSSEDLDAVLDYSFERYFQSSGLFGTPDSCLKIVSDLKKIGVDEIACLIDFGIDSDIVLAHLHYLNQLRFNSNKNITQNEINTENYSVETLINKYKVTHMQCTPSMANMLVMDDNSTTALSNLKTMLIGGEAFPVNLAKKLLLTIDGDLLNMYGPTETTIWSTIHKLSEPVEKSIPIGRPIANTQIYILDKHRQLVPAGVAGELCIGGDGVTNGYYQRPELTGDRFITNTFSNDINQIIYRTGDLAYYRNDGTIEFLGRLDHQVKIRGHRIELGEIESQLYNHSAVREAIVVAREDTPGDQRLVAYLIPSNGKISSDSLKTFLKEKLPEYMIPAHYISLSAFPLTPNGKINRKAFPVPSGEDSQARKKDFILPKGELEIKIAEMWAELLNLKTVGIGDNFFDIGGHSLLAVKLHLKLKQTVDEDLTLIDIFRFPTIKSLIEFMDKRKSENNKSPRSPNSKRVELTKHRLKKIKK